MGMTTQAQVGRPPETISSAQQRRLMRAFREDAQAIANARRKRRAFAVTLAQLRAEGASPSAMSRATGLSRQTLDTIRNTLSEGGT